MGTNIQTSDGRSIMSSQTVGWQMTAINGTDGNDSIRVARAAGFDGFDAVYFNGSTTEAYLFSINAPLTVLTINGKGGDDTITLDYFAGNLTPSGGNVVDGGAGNDTIAARGTTGSDNFTLTSTFVRRNTLNSTSNYSNLEGLDLLRGRFTMTNDLNGLNVTFEDATEGVMNSGEHLGNLTVLGVATVSMQANGNRLLALTSLALDPDVIFDLNDNDMLINYTGASPLATVQGLINNARNGGNWQGPSGLTSSAAANNAAHNTTLGAMEATDFPGPSFDGETLDSTTVLVKYTYYGDTDFNGKVNFDDYVRTDNGFNNHFTGWANGDFDGNGIVNFDDYVLIDLAFNTQTAVL
jgi:hypothetical protein